MGGEPFVQGWIIIERDSCWNVVANRNSKIGSGSLVYGGGIWPSYQYQTILLDEFAQTGCVASTGDPWLNFNRRNGWSQTQFWVEFQRGQGGNQFPYHPCNYGIFTYMDGLIFMVPFIGKYTSPMDGMVFGISPVGSKINHGARSTESENFNNDISCMILLTR